MRMQADLVDQLFNSSEKRLARILLLMAEFGKAGEPETLIPKVTQETLAEMIGTTRSRVSFFMNRFRKLGFVEYNGRIRVHKSLLRHNSARAAAGGGRRRAAYPSRRSKETEDAPPKLGRGAGAEQDRFSSEAVPLHFADHGGTTPVMRA